MARSRHVVFGCNGPVGIALIERLSKREDVDVTGVCRSGRADVPDGVKVIAADATDRDSAAAAAQGADVIYSLIGIDYRVWTEMWPRIIDGLLHAAESSGATLIFGDNLYCYGPTDEPLREDLPLTTYGKKPALRARMVETMMAAHDAGRTRLAFVRASDFFGPRTTNAHLGEGVFPSAIRGGRAQLAMNVDLPHTYTYVPDFARALETIAADDGALGEAWHVPNPPTRTTREIVEQIFEMTGQRPRMMAIPRLLAPIMGPFDPLLRELRELQFQFYRPYFVDHAKFAARFWEDATPWDEALSATLEWYRASGVTPQRLA